MEVKMIKLSFKKDKQSYFGINFKLYLKGIRGHVRNTTSLDKQVWELAQQKNIGKTMLYKPDNLLSIGIKHGIGKCGGSHHGMNEKQWLMPLKNADPDHSWLQQHVIPEAFQFYSSLKR